jgi:dihydrofolate reductase
MARLIFAANVSVDGYTEDEAGGFNWAPQDDDVFAAITEVMRSAGTYLYGRKMYEVLAPWETDPTLGARSVLAASYATVWQAARKIVYSTTLSAPVTANTQIETHFDVAALRELKTASPHDLLIGGPHLATAAFDADLVDDIFLFVWPVVLGGRNPALPKQHRRLVLAELQQFPSGAICAHYRVENRGSDHVALT